MNNDISTVKNVGIGDVQATPAQYRTITDPNLEPLPQPSRGRPASDAIAITTHARKLAHCKPDAINVLSAHDHGTRTAPVGPRRLEVDASGSYHLE